MTMNMMIHYTNTNSVPVLTCGRTAA